MIRTPLRPLARILDARAKGENPDAIETRKPARCGTRRCATTLARPGRRPRAGASGAVLLLGLLDHRRAHGHAGRVRTGEPRAAASGAEIVAQRADIVDRNGRILATNMLTHALYAQPARSWSIPARAAHELAEIFPELDAKAPAAPLHRWPQLPVDPQGAVARTDAAGARNRRSRPVVRPARDAALPQRHAGRACPGRRLFRRRRRGLGRSDRHRRHRESRWTPACATRRRPATPLTLSHRPDRAGRGRRGAGARASSMMNAKGGAAILMDVKTGEIIALASPARPSTPTTAPPARPRATPRTARCSTARCRASTNSARPSRSSPSRRRIDLGLVNPETMVDANAPMRLGQVHDQGIRKPQLRPVAVGHRYHRQILQRRHRPYRHDDRRRAPAGLPEIAGPVRCLAGRTGRGDGRQAAASRRAGPRS